MRGTAPSSPSRKKISTKWHKAGRQVRGADADKVDTSTLSTSADRGPVNISSPISGASGNTASAMTSASNASPTSAVSQAIGSPSSIVTLSDAGAAAAQAPLGASLAWENRSNDAVSTLMATNMTSLTPSGRFADLGSALLAQFSGKAATPAISQSVAQTTSSTQLNPYGSAAAVTPAILHGLGANQITLNVVTKSGAKVTLTLDDSQDGLAVQATGSGKLSDAERSALGQLADGFQKAIDGMTSDPPQISLDGLTQFDPGVLTSVDLQTSVKSGSGQTQTLAFHADAAQRTLAFDGPAGAVNVSVDLGVPASWGSQRQQTKAMNNYLQQFDQANARGNGDGSLMTLFKDAFTEMNSHYPGATQSASGPTPLSLNGEDDAMLTGLADFSASVTATSVSSNPRRLDEKDSFAYQVSQSTNIAGVSHMNLAMSQTQQSSLKAGYHSAVAAGVPLMLDKTLASQNYNYTVIDDSASSSSAIAYKEGKLVKATLSQSASQSTHVEKYNMGQLISDTTTPAQASLTRDLVAALAPKSKTNQPETALEIYQRQQQLAAINDAVFLQTDPSALNGEAQP
jgi:hypothetical protein